MVLKEYSCPLNRPKMDATASHGQNDCAADQRLLECGYEATELIDCVFAAVEAHFTIVAVCS